MMLSRLALLRPLVSVLVSVSGRVLLPSTRTVPSRTFARRAAKVVFFIQRAGAADFTAVAVAAGASVDTLKRAALAELRIDAPPDTVTLSRVNAGESLDVALTVADACGAGALAAGDKLVATVRPLKSAADVEADGRLALLAHALCAARAVPLEGAVSGASLVELPSGVEWPQLGAAPLFVRSFYEAFYEGVLSSCDASGSARLRRFTITGNAGIGKSAFACYLLWRAVRAQRAVVYVSAKEPRASIFHAGAAGVETCLSKDYFVRAEELLGRASTLLVCDGVPPPCVAAFTVLVTSPKRELWKQFDQLDRSRRLFFPVFSRREISDMLASCFMHLRADAPSGGEAGVWARYDTVGGIPRYVFNKIDDDLPAMLRMAVTRVLVENLEDFIGVAEIESDHVISHRLVRIRPVGEVEAEAREPFDAAAPHIGFAEPQRVESYAAARTELASPLAADLVVAEAARRRLKTVRSILAQPPDATLAQLYGALFEPAARRALAAGGAFEMWSLTEGCNVGPLVLKPSTLVSFASAAALGFDAKARAAAGALDTTIFAPRSANFTAVDAVLGHGQALINFTVNVRHTLLRYNAAGTEGVEPVADALGLGDDVTFIWVLPRVRFNEACARGPFPVSDAPSALRSRRIAQYALCVSFEHGV